MSEEETPKPEGRQVNSSKIEGGVMTITLYLDQEAGLAKALGALDMTGDLIKQYCTERAMREAQRRSQIIRPGLAN